MCRCRTWSTVAEDFAAKFYTGGGLQECPSLCAKDVVHPSWRDTACLGDGSPDVANDNEFPPVTFGPWVGSVNTVAANVDIATIGASVRTYYPNGSGILV